MRFAALLAFALVACNGEGEPPEITSFEADPATGAAEDVIALTVEVMHFTIGEHDMGDMEEHDEDHASGHVHVYWDSTDANPLVMMEEHMADMTVPADATTGTHTLIARLHGSDHLIIEPEVTYELDFDVTE